VQHAHELGAFGFDADGLPGLVVDVDVEPAEPGLVVDPADLVGGSSVGLSAVGQEGDRPVQGVFLGLGLGDHVNLASFDRCQLDAELGLFGGGDVGGHGPGDDLLGPLDAFALDGLHLPGDEHLLVPGGLACLTQVGHEPVLDVGRELGGDLLVPPGAHEGVFDVGCLDCGQVAVSLLPVPSGADVVLVLPASSGDDGSAARLGDTLTCPMAWLPVRVWWSGGDGWQFRA
jgi:hypothetical protein